MFIYLGIDFNISIIKFWLFFPLYDMNFSMTLLAEFQDKDFTNNEAKFLLQFGTNIYIVGLSLTFKS